MDGKTLAEKILSGKAEKPVVAGQTVDVLPDLMVTRDSTVAVLKALEHMASPSIFDPRRVAVVLDNAAPAPTTDFADAHRQIRSFVRDQGVRHFFDIGNGICHQVLPEEGLIAPGMLVLGVDSRTTHCGAFGALGLNVDFKKMAEVWASGTIQVKVPETIRIEVFGMLADCVSAKDVALYILAEMCSRKAATGKSVEFHGKLVEQMSIDDRQVLANLLSESGAKTVLFSADQKVRQWLELRGVADPILLHADSTATYVQEYMCDVTCLEPQVAAPGRADKVVPVSSVAGLPIDMAFIGTCTNGRTSDLAEAAAVLRGRTVSAGCRLFVNPASRTVYLEAIERGYIQVLVEAGAVINSPGCGPCKGHHMGVPAPGDTVMSSGSHNFKGRMGTSEADIYLASPLVVAASAVVGKITDPRGLYPS